MVRTPACVTLCVLVKIRREYLRRIRSFGVRPQTSKPGSFNCGSSDRCGGCADARLGALRNIWKLARASAATITADELTVWTNAACRTAERPLLAAVAWRCDLPLAIGYAQAAAR